MGNDNYHAACAHFNNGEYDLAFAGFKQLFAEKKYGTETTAANLVYEDCVILCSLADLYQLKYAAEEAVLCLNLLVTLANGKKGLEFFYYYGALHAAGIAFYAGDRTTVNHAVKVVSGELPNINDFTMAGLAGWQINFHLPGVEAGQKKIITTLFLKLQALLYAGAGHYKKGVSIVQFLVKQSKEEVWPVQLEGDKALLPLILAKMLIEKGDLRLAAEQLAASSGIVQGDKNPQCKIAWLEYSAKLNMLAGNFGAAESSLAEASRLQAHNLNGYIASVINLAKVKIYLNQTAQALDMLVSAEKLCNEQGITIFTNRLTAAKRMAQAKKVSDIAHLQQVHAAAAPQAGHAEMVGFEYLAYFEDRWIDVMLMVFDTLGTADKAFEQLSQEFGDTDSLLIRHRLTVLDYSLSLSTGATTPAKLKEDVDQAMQYFETEGINTEQWQLLRLIKLDTRPTGERDRLEGKINAILNDLALTLPEAEKVNYYLNKWADNEEYLSGLMNHAMQLADKHKRSWILTRFAVGSRLFLSINRLLTEIDSHKQKKFDDVQLAVKSSRAASTLFEQVGQYFLHPKDLAVMSFLVLPDRTAVIIRAKRFIKVETLPVTRLELRELVAGITSCMTADGSRRDLGSDDENTGNPDFFTLMKRFVDKTGFSQLFGCLPLPVKRICFVPDDALHQLSFATLYWGGKFLVENFAVSYSNRSFINNRRQLRRGQEKNGVLAYISKAITTHTQVLEKLPALPGTISEIETVKKVFDGNAARWAIEKLDNELVTKATLMQKMKDSALVHIACHGTFNHDKPGLSGFVLQDEMVTLADISTSGPFDNVGHLTLSSCRAADSSVIPGRWVISLPEIFYLAGVKSMLACIWTVFDTKATSLLEAFYRQALTGSKDTALQKAQADFIHPKNMYSHPYYWGGFVLFGDTGGFK